MENDFGQLHERLRLPSTTTAAHPILKDICARQASECSTRTIKPIISEDDTLYSYHRKRFTPTRKSAMYFLKKMSTIKCAAADIQAKPAVEAQQEAPAKEGSATVGKQRKK